MHCIILAGGFSTRLYPLTKTFPKTLLPIKGKAIVDYVYEDIRKQKDVTPTTVVTNELYFSLMEKHFSHAFSEDEITVISNGIASNEAHSGAVGDLLHAIQTKKIYNEDLLVVSSDTYTSLKLQDFIRFYKQFKGITVAAFDEHDKKKVGDSGWIEMQKNKVVKFAKKPENLSKALRTIPYYLFPKTSIQLLLEYQKINEEQSLDLFVPWAFSRTPIYVYNMGTGKYFDIGTTELYEEAKTNI